MNDKGTIANLDYRDYDGPLHAPRFRWWVIANEMCRQTFARRIYWMLTLLSGWYYLVLMTVVFFVEEAMGGLQSGGGGRGNQLGQFLERLVWKHQFIHGFSCGQFYFFLIALLIGAATIANDNRANALLIYLSKPLGKKDYMIGKWIGVFIPMLISMALPSLFFFIWGSLSYQRYGFLSNDPLMILRVLGAVLVSATLYTSLIVAASSLFNQSRIASASFAGVYIVLRIFTVAMSVAWIESQRPNGRVTMLETITNLNYASLDRFCVGIMKLFLDTVGSPWFGAPSTVPEIPLPQTFAMGSIFVILVIGSIALTWKRVRAIEVVG